MKTLEAEVFKLFYNTDKIIQALKSRWRYNALIKYVGCLALQADFHLPRKMPPFNPTQCPNLTFRAKHCDHLGRGALVLCISNYVLAEAYALAS